MVILLTNDKGFTIIELTIVTVIIGLVVSIIIPMYYQQTIKAKTSACLYEVKSYSNLVYIQLNEPNATAVSIASNPYSCLSITNASGWTSETQREIVAIAKSPSNARIECDIPNGSPCRVLP